MQLTSQEMEKIQTYLQQLFWNPEIVLRAGAGNDCRQKPISVKNLSA